MRYNIGVPNGTPKFFASQLFEGRDPVTIHEASARYNIPLEILKEYESWGLCGAVKEVMGIWQYDDTDIERLSLIMTLHDVGFESSIKNGKIRWMKFISAKSSLSGWTTSGITSASSRR